MMNTVITPEKGRSSSACGREEREMRTYDFLDSLGIEYSRADHEPADTMDKCREVKEKMGVKICKNLFLCNRQGTAFYLLLMPGDKPFKTKELSAQIGSARLSFGSEEKMLEYLDVTPGSASVLALMNDKDCRVTLLVDKDIYKEEYFGCHPCKNTSTVTMRTDDVFLKILPALHRRATDVTLVGAE